MKQTVKWDDSKAQDKEFLIEYYQSRANYWKDVKHAKKTYERFQKAADNLRKELTNE